MWTMRLLGRDRECARVQQLVAGAREGRSGVLVIRGEAGIGKSALLEYAREVGRDLVVLASAGVETESELAFSTLGDLLRPVLPALERIPVAQAAALRNAFALGPVAPPARYGVAAGTLSLLAAAAEEVALLATVDDAQWVDAGSSEALLFAARRLHAEGVAVLFGLRDGEPTTFASTGLPALELAGLERSDGAALINAQGRPIAPAVSMRLVDETRGNPLALIELPRLLSDGQRAGRDALDDPLPAGTALERAFLRRVSALPATSRRALIVAAASDSGELDAIVRALARIGLSASALESAESAGLIRIAGGLLEWSHPLLRSALYHGVPAAERRAAHAALAAALLELGLIERRAWHQAASSLAADEAVAEALEQVALASRARSGHAAAASAFERAAGLTPDDERRARRLLEAARDQQLVGRLDGAIELLDQALRRTADPLLRADIQLLRGATVLWGSSAPSMTEQLLAAEAARVAPLDPGRAVRMLAEASIAWTMMGDCPRSLESARQACALADRADSSVRAMAGALLGNSLVLCGEAAAADPLVKLSQRMFEASDPLATSGSFVQLAGHASVWIEDYTAARHVFDLTIDAARRASALALLSFPLACLSELDFRMGRWTSAYAEAAEAVRLADELEQLSELSFSLVCLARIEAAQGREADCAAHVARAHEIANTLGIGSIFQYAESVSGLCELGFGRTRPAIRHLERTGTLAASSALGETGVVQWAPDLIEAYVLDGRPADARQALARFEQQAVSTNRSWALAAAARARGMLASPAAFEGEFREALMWHDRLPTPFERARTELRFGERLRRAHRLSEARVALRSALETFDELGAVPWTNQARAELVASGGGGGPRTASSGVRQLTPQELQIAMLVSTGATNREVAATLFLSPKTVEFHLSNVYGKLGLRSRTELANLFSRRAPAAFVGA